MQYLTQPRGPGKSWVFRMVTPDALRGLANPRTGKPFGRKIKIGLGTRHLPTARKHRDVVLGELQQLAFVASGEKTYTLQDALDWRGGILDARENDPSGREAEAMGMVLTDLLITQEQRGAQVQPLERFARVALGNGFPLTTARDQYVKERSPGNSFNYKPLKPATVRELDIALGHLKGFMKDAEGTACMEDVTSELARSFRQEYLPSITSKQTNAPMSHRTADKYITMLRPMWDWAVSDRRLTSPTYKSNPWQIIKTVPRTKRTDKLSREAFTPSEMSQLLLATKRGTRGGDALRLALATGARINEQVLLTFGDIDGDAAGFFVREGKTENAARYIPLVGAARVVLRDRMEARDDRTDRLFPEWPIKPSTGSCGAVTRWFIDLRRKVLGDVSDGRLALHSTRHTWRTVARRAGVPDEDVKQLGGWAGDRSTSSIYDHGLTDDQLRAAQQMVWDEMVRSHYVAGF